MKRMMAVMLVLAMCAGLFTGCGGSSSAGAAEMSNDSMPEAQPMEQESAEAGETGFDGAGDAAFVPKDARKIIYTADLSLESKEFDKAREAILAAAQTADAYVQQSEEGGSAERGSRWVRYTFRVPGDHYREFLAGACESGNLLRKQESTEDVTGEYVDVEARLESLKNQEQRLTELSAKAETLEDLLAIEKQLSDVRYQIESYTGRKKVMDSLIQYSTVNVELREVESFTPVSVSFGSRLADAFRGSWKNFVAGVQDVVIALVYWLPALVVLGIAAAAVVFILRRNRKKRAERSANKPQNPAVPSAEHSAKIPAKYDQSK